jgi:hypothetical protein
MLFICLCSKKKFFCIAWSFVPHVLNLSFQLDGKFLSKPPIFFRKKIEFAPIL